MRYFKPRNCLLLLALILALVLFAVVALRYRPDSRLKMMVEALPEGVDVSLQDLDYTHVEEGQARWRLVARQVTHQSSSGALGVSSPRLNFFDKRGEVKGSLQASKGDVSEDYQKIRLRDSVVLKNSSGYTLYTDSLDYDHATQMATTDAYVRLVAGGVSLEGTGLVFYLKQGRLHLNTEVKGLLGLEEMK